MLLNLTDVFTSEGKDRRESLLFEPEAVSYMGEEYDILEKSLIQLTLSNGDRQGSGGWKAYALSGYALRQMPEKRESSA